MKLVDPDGTLPSGNYYSYEESLPAVEALAELQAKRYPKLADDILQAARLGCWEATRSGPGDLEVTVRNAKKRIAECIGDLVDRKGRELYTDAVDAVDSQLPDWWLSGKQRVEEFEALPDAQKKFLRLHFGENTDWKEAADRVGIPQLVADRLKRRYATILRALRPD